MARLQQMMVTVRPYNEQAYSPRTRSTKLHHAREHFCFTKFELRLFYLSWLSKTLWEMGFFCCRTFTSVVKHNVESQNSGGFGYVSVVWLAVGEGVTEGVYAVEVHAAEVQAAGVNGEDIESMPNSEQEIAKDQRTLGYLVQLVSYANTEMRAPSDTEGALVEICRGKNAFEDQLPGFDGAFGGDGKDGVLEADLKFVQHGVVWFASMGERKEE
ncbi:hypothetical protein N431DRAFT_451633 [Stipitochalara longipes BDJ]|nr:hypothetical protein N431DRAFT_451633 [Stipitochalara longipes BDJ]